MRATSSNPVVYAEVEGAEHAFDVVPTTRNIALLEAVDRFPHAVRGDGIARPDPSAIEAELRHTLLGCSASTPKPTAAIHTKAPAR